MKPGTGTPLNSQCLIRSRETNRSSVMGKIKDKVVGTTKQIVGKVTADDRLAEEGKQQDKKADTALSRSGRRRSKSNFMELRESLTLEFRR